MQLYPINGCCAVHEIVNLSEHNGDSENAMKAFCSYWSQNEYGARTKKLIDPGAFIIFTGVEYDKEDCVDVGYGSAFAQYIKDNNLGVVVESPKRYNRRNEPDHQDQIWIWAPSFDHLREWYNKHKD